MPMAAGRLKKISKEASALTINTVDFYRAYQVPHIWTLSPAPALLSTQVRSSRINRIPSSSAPATKVPVLRGPVRKTDQLFNDLYTLVSDRPRRLLSLTPAYLSNSI